MGEPIEFSDWLQQRCGLFTASENHKLWSGGRRNMTYEELKEEKDKGGKRKTVDTLFGETAFTYIKTKAAERLTLQVKEETNFIQTNYGKEHEYDAWRLYEKTKGISGRYYGTLDPKFYKFSEYTGGSPDFICEGSKIGADFKCPYNSEVHLNNLLLTNQEDFKNAHFDYYCQNQFLMYNLGLKEFDFVSYDPRFIEDHLKLKILTCIPDVEWIDEYIMREKAAIEELNRIISYFN